MKVIAIIPTLGKRETLVQARQAINSQTKPPDEIVEARSLDLPTEVADILKLTGAEFAAIVDDDVTVPPDFIERGLKHFEDPKMAYVGSPLILPPLSELTDPMKSIAKVQASRFGSFKMRMKFVKGAPKEDADEMDIQGVGVYRASAYIAALDSMKHIPFAGWETKIVRWFKEHDMKAAYDPEMGGIHRPRGSVLGFAKQSWRDGWGRAVYLKMWSADLSRKPWFVIPALFALAFIFLPFLFFPLWFLMVIMYTFVAWVSGRSLSMIQYYFVCHFFFGLGFLYGAVFKRKPR